jgi:hypothetical protein
MLSDSPVEGHFILPALSTKKQVEWGVIMQRERIEAKSKVPDCGIKLTLAEG